MKKKKWVRRVSYVMLTGILLGSLSATQVSSTATTENRTYVVRRYNSYGHLESHSTYTLSMTDDEIATYSVPGVNGTDSRYQDSNSSIVHYSGRFIAPTGFEPAGGTGFIVGENVIATAAHCVYSQKRKDYASLSSVYLTDPDTGKTHPVGIESVHIPKNYIDNITSSNDRHNYDYALIVLNTDVDLSEYGCFSLGVLDETATEEDRIPITISGFPSYLQGEDGSEIRNESDQLYTGTDYLLNVENQKFHYLTDVSSGDSGGPAYVSVKYTKGSSTTIQNTVVGICTGDSRWDSNHDGMINTDDEYANTACRITAPLLQFYLQNPNLYE